MFVEEVMSLEPITALATTTVREVLLMMGEKDIRHLPIAASGKLVGMVSNRDLRPLVPSGLAYPGDPHEVQRMLDRPIAEAMNRDVISVHPKSPLTQALDLMIEHRVGAVPVVEPEGEELVGILSYIDVLRVARRFL